MKTRFFLFAVTVIAISFGSRSVQAQYPGQIGLGPGMQVQPGMVPMGQPAVMPANLTGGSPFGAPAAFIPASPALSYPTHVMPASHNGGCGSKGCASSCNDCCDTKGGKGKGHDAHAWEFFGDFLYLRARDAEVAYAVPFNGPNVPPNTPRVQVGEVGVADMDFQPSFRAGFNYYLNDCTKFSARYTMFESGTTDQVLRGNNPVYVVHSLVSHPSTSNAAQDFVQADAQYDISMDIVDLDLQKLFYNDANFQLGWLLGIRLAQQEQNFRADFAGTGTEQVVTDIDFTGIGLRFGLAGEMSIAGQWFGYANMTGNIVPGEFNTSFRQTQSFDPDVVNTGWEAGRIVTMWDLELGVSRVSHCGNFRLSGGYMFSAWTNVVQTDEWIEAVHTNNFIGMDSTMTFDGFVARFEARY